jgi:hypothetical protein
MAKKGFAALLASKLHNKENVSDSAQTHLFKSVSTVFNKQHVLRILTCIVHFIIYFIWIIHDKPFFTQLFDTGLALYLM